MAVTNIEKFTITYQFRNREITVNCERFNIDAKTQIWVPVLDKKGYIKYAHVFWENLVPGHRFFRYPLPEPKESEANAILSSLSSQLALL